MNEGVGSAKKNAKDKKTPTRTKRRRSEITTKPSDAIGKSKSVESRSSIVTRTRSKRVRQSLVKSQHNAITESQSEDRASEESSSSHDAPSTTNLPQPDDEHFAPEYFDPIQEKYKLVEKVGEGTFSSVFKCRRKSDNESVAIKCIYQTSSPNRVANEMMHLLMLRNEPTVCHLIDSVLVEDRIFLVLPYFPHEPFKTYFLTMTVADISHYLRALLSAVASVHKYNIIHRDVKPSNFLRSVDGERYLLIDFGLAQSETSTPTTVFTDDDVNAFIKSLNNSNPKPKTKKVSSPMLTRRVRTRSSASKYRPKRSGALNSITRSTTPRSQRTTRTMKQTAPRAGTRGFRAPEVLMRAPNQTTSIDVWSVGVCLLCLLTRRYPFFNSPDDITGFLEIACVLGSNRLSKAADAIGKRLTFPKEFKSVPFDTLVSTFNPDLHKSVPACAIELLELLLEPECDKRITAEDALKKEFVTMFV